MAVATARRPSGPVLSAAHCCRSASPTRVKLAGGAARQSVSVSSSSSPSSAGRSRRTCMCSPTNHPGSFRCSLHKERKAASGHKEPTSPPSPRAPTSSRRQMGNAIGAVEGSEWARRALAATSPAAQHRRRSAGESFKPRPSRLSAVSVAGERAGDNDSQ